MSEPLQNVEKLILVLIQARERMNQKEYAKTSDDSLSNEYKQGYSDAHRDWHSVLLKLSKELSNHPSIKLI